MQRKFTYLLPLVLAALSGCFNAKTPTPNSSNVPSGTFTGTFRVIHLHKNGKLDTATANLQLSMTTSTGYQVTGDTTIHAASFGAYVIGSNLASVAFYDNTYPLSGTPTKYHLSGTYAYSYDGTNLQILGASALDTLTYQYTFKKM